MKTGLGQEIKQQATEMRISLEQTVANMQEIVVDLDEKLKHHQGDTVMDIEEELKSYQDEAVADLKSRQKLVNTMLENQGHATSQNHVMDLEEKLKCHQDEAVAELKSDLKSELKSEQELVMKRLELRNN
nr:unnamed protein product [Callosobruchus chinensis]